MSDDLDFALHLADIADAISLGFFRSGPRTRTKHDGSIVTEADEAVERAIRTEIAATHPGDGVFGEEEGDTSGAASRRWIIDPIDGTVPFAAGIPIWATLIALEVDGEVRVGVASAPALRERYDAERGRGARRDGEPIAVSDVEDLAQARLMFTSFRSFAKHRSLERFTALAQAVSTARGYGDFWGHMLVASGHADIMAECVVSPWDVAATIVIVEEAGGRFTDLDGERTITGGSALSTNRRLHDEVLARLAT